MLYQDAGMIRTKYITLFYNAILYNISFIVEIHSQTHIYTQSPYNHARTYTSMRIRTRTHIHTHSPNSVPYYISEW